METASLVRWRGARARRVLAALAGATVAGLALLASFALDERGTSPDPHASGGAPTTTTRRAPKPRASFKDLWLSRAQIARLPRSGRHWRHLKRIADSDIGEADVSDQNSPHGTRAFGVALVYARTRNHSYRDKARRAIMSAVGTEGDARSLALGRNLAAYVLAADLIDLSAMSPSDHGRFRSWIYAMRNRENPGNSRWSTLILTSDNTSNNWGAFATASRIAIDLYLGDTTDLARAAQIHRAYADREAYPDGKPWGDYFQPTADFDPEHWACGGSRDWVALNPPCTKNGHDLDGALVEDISRESQGRTLLPQPEDSDGVSYSWETLQALTVQAELLRRAGYASLWQSSSKALRRATSFIQRAGWHEKYSVTKYVPWLVNRRYGMRFPVRSGGYGRLVGFTEWTHAPVRRAARRKTD